VLEDRVIARPVRKAHAMDVRFDQARYDRPATEIDDACIRPGSRSRIPCCNDPAIAYGDHWNNGVCRIHGMNSTVGERERGVGSNRESRILSCSLNYRAGEA